MSDVIERERCDNCMKRRSCGNESGVKCEKWESIHEATLPAGYIKDFQDRWADVTETIRRIG